MLTRDQLIVGNVIYCYVNDEIVTSCIINYVGKSFIIMDKWHPDSLYTVEFGCEIDFCLENYEVIRKEKKKIKLIGYITQYDYFTEMTEEEYLKRKPKGMKVSERTIELPE